MAEPGQPNAAVLELCFWEALKRCAADEGVPLQVVSCDGDDDGGISFGPRMPAEFWQYMETALDELREAAGLTTYQRTKDAFQPVGRKASVCV